MKLYRVCEFGGTGSYITQCKPSHEVLSCVVVKPNDLDSYDIADFLDQFAENENRHELCGVHASLAKLIRVNADEQAADTVMRAILKAGGLWEMGR